MTDVLGGHLYKVPAHFEFSQIQSLVQNLASRSATLLSKWTFRASEAASKLRSCTLLKIANLVFNEIRIWVLTLGVTLGEAARNEHSRLYCFTRMQMNGGSHNLKLIFALAALKTSYDPRKPQFR